MKTVVAIVSLMSIPVLSMAADKSSEPFSYSIVSRVCTAGVCELSSSGDSVQAILKEDPKKPGNYSGEIKSTYTVNNVQLESRVQVSQFAYGPNYQTNLFLSTNEVGST